MFLDLDKSIVVAFLLINICAGIYHGRNIKSLKYYAIGNRIFSTNTITATIIASWIGAGFFTSVISETYHNGLWHIVARFGDFLTLWIVGVFFAPRIGEFFGKITVAEIMNDLYGAKIRTITAISAIALSIGYVAVQIKVFSTLFSYFFGVPIGYAALIGSFVIIVYSSFGGILSVTFTDVIQLFTFGIFIPIFAFFLWSIFGDPDAIMMIFNNNPLFDYKAVFNHNDPNFYISIALFTYFTLPALDPVTFQRILMAKNIKQVRDSFVNASMICLLIGIMGFIIAIISFAHNPSINPDTLVMYVIDNYAFTGLKGLTLIAIMAMGMSTADSYMNASSVIFVHDLCRPLGIINFIKDDLLLARLITLIIGISSIFLVLFSTDIFDLLLLAGNFYTPIVTVPLMLAIFGFRTTPRVVLAAMFSGFIAVIVWRIHIQSLTNIDSIIPGTIANLFVLISFHYLLKEPGGWVGIKYQHSLLALKRERGIKFKRIISRISTFNILNFLKSNLPKDDNTYSVFALFVMLSTYLSLYSMFGQFNAEYQKAYYFIYHSTTIFTMCFLTYPIWSLKLKNEAIISIAWLIGIFYLLVFVGISLVIISNFDQLQLMILIINLLVVGALLKWQTTLFMISLGFVISLKIFEVCVGKLPLFIGNTHLQIIGALLLFASALIAFLKPKQQEEELAKVIKSHLEYNNQQKQFEIIRLSKYQEEFVNRLDKQCISVFRSVYQKILELDEQLHEPVGGNLEQPLVAIVNKLKSGAEYLDSIISYTKDYVIICPNEINIENFIYNLLDEYRKINAHQHIHMLSIFKIVATS